MSRGYGIAMHTVLDRLAELDQDAPRAGWHSLADIAGQDATRARRESLRRAAKTLARGGVVLTSYRAVGRVARLHVRALRHGTGAPHHL